MNMIVVYKQTTAVADMHAVTRQWTTNVPFRALFTHYDGSTTIPKTFHREYLDHNWKSRWWGMFICPQASSQNDGVPQVRPLTENDCFTSEKGLPFYCNLSSTIDKNHGTPLT